MEEIKIRTRGFLFSRSRLEYDPEMIPENGAVNVLVRLKHGYFPRIVEKTEVFEEVCIGEKGDEELCLSQSYHFRFQGELCQEKRVFRISELKNTEDIEYIKHAPRIIFTGLCREGGDLLYSPIDAAFDAEVFANQRKALLGEIPEIKTFAVRCGPAGMIHCHFYNERTQQLSEFILKYSDNKRRSIPVCVTVEYGLAEYLIVYESCFGENYVLQYTDTEGRELNKKTYIALGLCK